MAEQQLTCSPCVLLQREPDLEQLRRRRWFKANCGKLVRPAGAPPWLDRTQGQSQESRSRSPQLHTSIPASSLQNAEAQYLIWLLGRLLNITDEVQLNSRTHMWESRKRKKFRSIAKTILLNLGKPMRKGGCVKYQSR